MKKLAQKSSRILTLMLFFSIIYLHQNVAQNTNTRESLEGVSVIHSSDFALPHGDPDDHFDILTIFASKNINIKAVVLDHPNPIPGRAPNYNAVKQAALLFDRPEVPAETGLRFKKLSSPNDAGYDYYEEQYKAIELLLSTLRSSEDNGVVITTVGGLRDIAAAYNREPELFHLKIRRLIISVGDSYGLNGIADTNTKRDINAWKRIMSSGLPIDWMPTNPSKGRGAPSRYCSYWYFIQSELLSQSPQRIRDFMKSEDIDPDAAKQRHMWSTPAFVELSGRKCYMIDGEIKWLLPNELPKKQNFEQVNPYDFVPVNFSLTDEGVAQWSLAGADEETNVRIFRMNDYFLYNDSMFEFLRQQFNR